jgi:hypothetical protein
MRQEINAGGAPAAVLRGCARYVPELDARVEQVPGPMLAVNVADTDVR